MTEQAVTVSEDDERINQICAELHSIRTHILKLSEEFTGLTSPDAVERLLAVSENRETIAQVSYAARAERDGEHGWQALLRESMPGLVTSLVSRALKEHVWDKIVPVDTPMRTEREEGEQKVATQSLGLSKEAVDTLVYRLYKLLRPLFNAQSPAHEGIEAWACKLQLIVTQAVRSAHAMRACGPGVIFEWTEVYKDFNLITDQTECLNLGLLLEQKPLKKGKFRGGRPLQIIAAAPGLTVWRSRSKPLQVLCSVDNVGDGRIDARQEGIQASLPRLQAATKLEARHHSYESQVLMKGMAVCSWQKPMLSTRYAHAPESYLRAMAKAKAEDEPAVESLWDMFVQQQLSQRA